MRIRCAFPIISILFSTQSFAFPCIVTLVKDRCWSKYEVTIDVKDAEKNQSMVLLTVPKGKSWVRGNFTCEPNQKLSYSATFTPAIGKSTTGHVYQTQSILALPAAPKAGEQAWVIPVCYPAQFAEVPLPLTAELNCGCDFDSVPSIPPVQLPAK